MPATRDCPTCGGTREVEVPHPSGWEEYGTIYGECPRCRGTGRAARYEELFLAARAVAESDPVYGDEVEKMAAADALQRLRDLTGTQPERGGGYGRGPLSALFEKTEPGGGQLTRAPMGLVGRGSALLQRFADDLSRSFGGPPIGKAKWARLDRNRVSRLVKGREGGYFDVSLVDDDGRPTGYVARVTVSYAGFDADEANRSHPSPEGGSDAHH